MCWRSPMAVPIWHRFFPNFPSSFDFLPFFGRNGLRCLFVEPVSSYISGSRGSFIECTPLLLFVIIRYFLRSPFPLLRDPSTFPSVEHASFPFLQFSRIRGSSVGVRHFFPSPFFLASSLSFPSYFLNTGVPLIR